LENFSLGEVNSSTIVSSPEIITSKILPNKTISFSKVLDKYLTLDNNITSKKKIIAEVCKIFIIFNKSGQGSWSIGWKPLFFKTPLELFI